MSALSGRFLKLISFMTVAVTVTPVTAAYVSGAIKSNGGGEYSGDPLTKTGVPPTEPMDFSTELSLDPDSKSEPSMKKDSFLDNNIVNHESDSVPSPAAAPSPDTPPRLPTTPIPSSRIGKRSSPPPLLRRSSYPDSESLELSEPGTPPQSFSTNRLRSSSGSLTSSSSENQIPSTPPPLIRRSSYYPHLLDVEEEIRTLFGRSGSNNLIQYNHYDTFLSQYYNRNINDNGPRGLGPLFNNINNANESDNNINAAHQFNEWRSIVGLPLRQEIINQWIAIDITDKGTAERLEVYAGIVKSANKKRKLRMVEEVKNICARINCGMDLFKN